jgi:hypothetical protein
MKSKLLILAMILVGLQHSYGQTNLPSTLNCSEILTITGSPYIVDSTITIKPGCTLTVNAGVEIKMAENTHLIVQGKVDFLGTAIQPILIHAKDTIWGNIMLDSATTQKSTFHYVNIENARKGVKVDNEWGAIFGYYSTFEVKNCNFKNNLRCVSMYQCPNVLIKDCVLDSTNSGEKLHGQYCNGATIDNCILYATAGDADAIDFDASNNIMLSNNYMFAGGDDGFDIGQVDSIGCNNVTIQGNYIFNMFNKGISCGEFCLNMNLNHNLIVGCGWGIGCKSGAHAIADHNTIYHDSVGVKSYDHLDQIWGPGHLTVTNCIIAACDTAFHVDPTAFLSISYSLSDDTLMPGIGNLVGDPKFISPITTLYPECCNLGDFHLMFNSAAIDNGDPSFPHDPDGTITDIGRFYLGQSTSGIKTNSFLENELIYPNPSNGKFTLKLFPDNKMDRLVVLNILGESIFENEFLGNKVDYQIDLSSQSKGIYYLKLYTENKIVTQKVIVY